MQKIKGRHFAFALFLVVSTSQAFAEGAHCSTEGSCISTLGKPTTLQIELVKSKIQKLGLKAEVHAISEIPGLIEIDDQSGTTYFTDGAARYIIVGHLLDPIARKDLTMERLNQHKIVQLKQAISKHLLIQGGDKHAKASIVVFDDPDCPFCRKLESQLTANSGVKAFRVMTPLTQLHPQAEVHAQAILCARDKNKVLESIMLNGQNPQNIKCGDNYTALRAVHARLSKLYSVNGTPTLVRLNDGQVWNGYMPGNLLKRWAAGENIDANTVNAAIQAGL